MTPAGSVDYSADRFSARLGEHQSASRGSDGARHETARSVTGVEIGRASSPDVTHGQRNRSQLPRGREVRLW